MTVDEKEEVKAGEQSSDEEDNVLQGALKKDAVDGENKEEIKKSFN